MKWIFRLTVLPHAPSAVKSCSPARYAASKKAATGRKQSAAGDSQKRQQSDEVTVNLREDYRMRNKQQATHNSNIRLKDKEEIKL